MLQKHFFVAFLWMLVLAAWAPSAFALDQDETHFCRNGAFSDEPVISPMRVTATGRTYLRWDGGSLEGCPGLDACRHGYVVAGQEVLAGKHMGDFVCVYYAPSGSAGFVPAAALTPAPPAPHAPPLDDWAGHWSIDHDEDATIDIAVHNNTLSADGEAYWPGRQATRDPNEGEFSANATPSGDRLVLADGECAVTLRHIGAHLIASDNAQCGGANVRFSGVYTRAAR